MKTSLVQHNCLSRAREMFWMTDKKLKIKRELNEIKESRHKGPVWHYFLKSIYAFQEENE